MSLRECSQVRETDGGGGTDIKVRSGLRVSARGHHGLPAVRWPLTRAACHWTNDHPGITYLSSTHNVPGTVLHARTRQE